MSQRVSRRQNKGVHMKSENMVKRSLLRIGIVVLFSTGTLACSSNKDASPKTTAAASQDTEVASPEMTTAAADASAVGLAAATKFLEPYLTMPTNIGITEPLNGSIKGKKVMFAECSAPNCKEIADNMAPGLKLLGAEFTRVPAGGTPEEFAAAYDTMIEKKPDVVVGAGINAGFISKQLDILEKMGIPVISQATGEEVSHGVDKELLSPGMWTKAGRAAAAYVTVNSGGEAHVLYLRETVFLFATPSFTGFQSSLAEFCPKCTVTELKVPVTDIGTKIPGQVVSAFQADSKLNYITNSYGAQAIGAVEALKEAGITNYKLFNQAGVAYNYNQLLTGDAIADMSVSPRLDGWALVDSAARAALGQDLSGVDDPNLPWIYFVTKDNIDWDPTKATFPGVTGLEDQFKKIWGVS